jgi:hypothetical protein
MLPVSLMRMQSLRKVLYSLARGSSGSRPYSAAYASPMAETFYNDEQREMQSVFKKVTSSGAVYLI